MDKRNENIEDIFGKGFEDFKPKTSKKFDKKMIANIGVPLVGSLTFAATAKAIFSQFAAWVKILGVTKALLIVMVTIAVAIAMFVTVDSDGKMLNTMVLADDEISQIYINEEEKNPIALMSGNSLDEQKKENEEINDLIIEETTNESKLINSQKDYFNVIPVIQEEVIEEDAEREEQLTAIATPDDSYEDASIDEIPKGIQSRTAFGTLINAPDSLAKRDDEQLIPQEATDFEAMERNEIFKLSNYHKYGDVYFMPFMFRNSFSDQLVNSDSVIEQYISETPQLSFLFGFDFHLQHKQRPWFLNVGLNYQIIKENVDYHFKIAYDGKVPSYWEYDSTYYIIVNPPNIDTIYAVDSTYQDHWTREEAYKSNSNTYQYLNIPLLVGFNFLKKRSKVNVELATGIALALRMKSSGYLYNDFGEIINYDDVELKPVVDWYYLANVGIYYKQTHLTMFLQPSIKYQLNKTYIDHSSLKRKYFIYGLRFGVRIKLF